jgi:hypothetical protein
LFECKLTGDLSHIERNRVVNGVFQTARVIWTPINLALFALIAVLSIVLRSGFDAVAVSDLRLFRESPRVLELLLYDQEFPAAPQRLTPAELLSAITLEPSVLIRKGDILPYRPSETFPKTGFGK